MSGVLSSGGIRISAGLNVEFFYDPAGGGSLEVHWAPAPPSRLTPVELSLYRTTRNRFLKRIGEQLGGSVLVIEA
jgi:hypothetical protein